MEQPDTKQKLQIVNVAKDITNLLKNQDVPLEISSSALMILTAEITAASFNSIENIMEQFERCLKQARNEQ